MTFPRSFLHFPWAIYRRYILLQVLAFNAVFWILVSTGYGPLMQNFGAQLGRNIYIDYFILTVLFAILSSSVAVMPLWRVISRLKYLSNRREEVDIFADHKDLSAIEHGEFSELTKTINKIEQKLRRRKDQLKKEQSELAAFMSSIEESIFSIGLDDRILFFNSAFATSFMRSDLLKLPDIYLRDVFRVPEVLDGFSKALVEGKRQRFETWLELIRDQETRYFLVSVSPVRHTQTGEIFELIGIFHDLTEVKKSEKARIDFVTNASHELRTPLTSLRGYTQTLVMDLKAGQTEQALKFAQILDRNVVRLTELVTDLLQISALEAKGELKHEWTDPMEISEAVMVELSPMAQNRKQVITVTSNSGPVWVDRSKFEQVLRNLVSNAISYIPEGSRIEVKWSEDENGSLLEVSDNGPGIPEEHHDRLFERFYRVDFGRAREAGGTGLGLAIVKSIVQSHGGQVGIRRSKLGGSEFYCTIPKAKLGPVSGPKGS